MYSSSRYAAFFIRLWPSFSLAGQSSVSAHWINAWEFCFRNGQKCRGSLLQSWALFSCFSALEHSSCGDAELRSCLTLHENLSQSVLTNMFAIRYTSDRS